MTRRDKSSARIPRPPDTGRSSKVMKLSTTSWMSERDPSGLPNGVWEGGAVIPTLLVHQEMGGDYGDGWLRGQFPRGRVVVDAPESRRLCSALICERMKYRARGG